MGGDHDPYMEDFRIASRRLEVLVRRLASGDPLVVRTLRRLLDEAHVRWMELFVEDEGDEDATNRQAHGRSGADGNREPVRGDRPDLL